MPSGPKMTASTSGVSDTQMTTMSASAAAAAGVSAIVTPCSASSGARPAVRFQPVTGNPALARLAAIAAPIVPRPTKPIRSTTTSNAASGGGDPDRRTSIVPRQPAGGTPWQDPLPVSVNVLPAIGMNE